MLQGTIPSEIGQLSSIEDLWLYVSKNNLKSCPNDADMSFRLYTKLFICLCIPCFFQKNNIDGSIPTEIGKMIHLETLYLNDTSLTGPIPTELGLLRNAYSINLEVSSSQR